jgi:uncharacterized protein (DUF1697 family)
VKTYVAMLRGINVTGRNMILMEDLRGLFTAAGFEEARTYIQSGNVVFRASSTASRCILTIERMLEKRMGKPIRVVIRTASELRSVIDDNPFVPPGSDEKRVSVSFLTEKPARDRLKALEGVPSARDRFAAREKEIYLYTPDGFGTSKLAAAHERVLGVGTTVRNLNTVKKLYEMATR